MQAQALFVALGSKLIDKEGISKEEMSGIVDEAGALLSQGIVSMHQALQLLPWLRKDLRRCDKGRERLAPGGPISNISMI